MFNACALVTVAKQCLLRPFQCLDVLQQQVKHGLERIVELLFPNMPFANIFLILGLKDE